jgi:ATP-dependent Clp protease ATP-binding subunit ClpA
MNPFKALSDMRTIGRLLTDAEQVARRMGDERPSAEHLLLAAMTLPDGTAAGALQRLGVDAGRLAQAIRDEHAAGLVAAGIDAATAAAMATDRPVTPTVRSGVYRSNPSAQELFQAAGAAARSARQRLAGAHVVLAAADLQHGTLARALDRLEVDRAALRAAAESQLAAPA